MQTSKLSTFCILAAGGVVVAGLMTGSAAGAADKSLPGDRVPTRDGDLIIHPINHATLALGWKQLTLYVDPVGGAERFANLPPPDVILFTDLHGDHFDAKTLRAVATDKTRVVAPPATAALLPAEFKGRATVLSGGETQTVAGLSIEAIPAYNLTPERAKFHPKGRGVGFVVTLADQRVYLSGDTEDIPEMRALKDIGVAFVCMNLPYTMTVEQAASAVREFRPRVVYPYHYRGSDLAQFKKLVGEDAGVEVRIRDWYK